MHISKITILGFRSFKDCEIKSFSPGQNVIVGPNGSGKSNLICAIEFVLTRNYYRLNARQRAQLICHKKIGASGQEIKSASVTIEFDNSDLHFPMTETSLVLKRQITSKTDQYFINGKNSSYTQIIAVLESGGFSINNCYYLVKQGVITEIAMSSPKYLLDILRGISGAKSFDEKRTKSLKLIKDCDDTIQKMEAKVEIVGEHIRMLNIDDEKIKKYYDLNKTKRYLTTKLSQLQLRSCQTQSSGLRHEIETISDQLQIEQKDLCDLECNLARLNRQSKTVGQTVEEMTRQIDSIVSIMDTIVKELCNLRGDYDSQQKQQQLVAEISKNIGQQLETIEKQLHENQTSIKLFNTELITLQNEENDSKKQIELLEQRKRNLYNLLQICSNVDTVDERDDRIADCLVKIDGEIGKYRNFIQDYRRQLDEIKEKQDELKKLIKDNVRNEKEDINEIEPKKVRIDELNCKLRTNEIKKREVINEISLIQQEYVTLENDLKEIENHLNFVTNNMAIVGRKSVQQVLHELRTRLEDDDGSELGEEERQHYRTLIEGYRGQVIDCVNFNKPIYGSIEALLNNKLFNHIVDTQQIAIDLLELVDRGKLFGSFIFMPLNQIVIKDFEFDSKVESTTRTQSLLEHMRYAPECDLAIQFLFQGLFICSSFENCITCFDGSRNCDFTTLTGEMIDRRGIITTCGKFGRSKPTKIELFLRWKELSEKLLKLKSQLIKLEEDRERLINESGEWSVELNRLKQELNQLETIASTGDEDDDEEEQEEELSQIAEQEQKSAKFSRMMKRIYQYDGQIDSIKSTIESIDNKLICLEEERNFYRETVDHKSDDPGLLSEFTGEQQELIDNLAQQIRDNTIKFNRLVKNCGLKEIELNNLKNSLINLTDRRRRLRLEELKRTLSEKRLLKMKSFHVGLERKLESHRTRHTELNEQLNETIVKQMELKRNIKEVDGEFEEKNKMVDDLKKHYCEKMKNVSKLAENVVELQADVEQTEAIISFNIEAKYRQMRNIDEINKTLQSIGIELRNLCRGKISSETIKKYEDMRTKQDSLIELRESMLSNMNDIKNFIMLIDAKKHDIIMRTYKQVNLHFQRLFKQFVPNGSACIQFIYNPNSRQNHGSNNAECYSDYQRLSDSQSSQSVHTSLSTISGYDFTKKVESLSSQVDDFEGLEILVSFSGKEPDSDMLSLSGGQKSIVSLSFIFALQKVDPTPFYIFDEVDQNLDESYRTAVAEIINKQAKEYRKQFILTTFRAQLLQNADKFYGVSMENSLSSVTEISQEDAINFITKTIQLHQREEEEERFSEKRSKHHPKHGVTVPSTSITSNSHITERGTVRRHSINHHDDQQDDDGDNSSVTMMLMDLASTGEDGHTINADSMDVDLDAADTGDSIII